MFSLKWLKQTGVKCVRTFAQAALGAIGTNAVAITELDVVGIASISATAALVCFLSCVAFDDKQDDYVYDDTSGNLGESGL